MKGFFLAHLSALLLVLPVVSFTSGCVSTQSSRSSAAAHSAAIGTWEYNVTGFGPLDQGVFRISVKNGRLHATVRDLRRGRLRAEVRIHDSRMELTAGNFHISGRIEEGRFSGFLRPNQWDATVSSSQRREPWQPDQTASLYAERVQSGTLADKPSSLACTSILREADGCN